MNTSKQKKRTALVPQYMRSFVCTGSECEDTCCKGWTISVDKATYKKYVNIKNPVMRPTLKKLVKRNRPAPSSLMYATIQLDETGYCPMLSEEKLCSIQVQLGEEYLSHTCAVYPRGYNEINGVMEISATMSCPETARLALLNPDGIEFDEIEIDPVGFVTSKIDTTQPDDVGTPLHYFWDLRVFTIQVLQNRSYSVPDRLILLGLFYQSLQESLDKERPQDIAALLQTYKERVENGAYRDSLVSIPKKTGVQLNLLKLFIDHSVKMKSAQKRYIDSYNEFIQGLGITDDSTEEEIIARYEDANDRYFAPFLKEHGYILENYLVNYVFSSKFPLGAGKRLFTHYTQMVLQVSLIKMMLIGMSGYHKGLTPEQALRAIQSFARANEHSTTFFPNILKMFDESGYSNLPYMTILIKN